MASGFEPSGYGTYVWEGTPIVRQLAKAGVLPGLTPVEVSRRVVRATAPAEVLLGLIVRLKRDERFASGLLHQLHKDIGPNRVEFRSHLGSFGKRSMQIVLDPTTGRFYADLDRFNPYSSVAGWVGHAGEVIGGWWRRLRS